MHWFAALPHIVHAKEHNPTDSDDMNIRRRKTIRPSTGGPSAPACSGYTPPPRAAIAVPGYPFLEALDDPTYTREGAHLGTHEGET